MGIKELNEILRSMKRVAVAFSGGVDSSALLAVAMEQLGKENTLPIRAHMATSTPDDETDAEMIESILNIRAHVIEIDTLSNPDFVKNPRSRCYICKRQMFAEMQEYAKQHGFDILIDGSNMDDLSDFRPGMKALRELGIRSPFIEAKITKEQIRTIAKRFDLPVWSKPASACLASRIPYGEHITQERLQRIAKAETFLRTSLGIALVRVRDVSGMAIIETDEDGFEKICKPQKRIHVSEILQRLGFSRVTVDLAGYRRGSLNETK